MTRSEPPCRRSMACTGPCRQEVVACRFPPVPEKNNRNAMKKITRLYLLAVAFATVGCNRPATEMDAYSVSLYEPVHASGFEILGAEGVHSTLLKVLNPWQGAENTATLLFIARDGETAPPGFDGQIVAAGARRIVCMSSSHVAMLDALGQVDRVVGVSGKAYVSNPHVCEPGASVVDVGYDGNVDYESLLAQKPDLVLLYGIGGASGMESKLRELGIPFCYIGEYLEESPLGKAEWLVALSEITGSRAAGEAVFAPIPERYEALKKLVAKAASDKPRIMVNTPYAGSWFMASTASYAARLIADAGGDYIYRKNTSNRSVPIDPEEAYLLLSQADKWLIAGTASSLDELKAHYPKFADIRCVREGAVYNSNKRLNAAGGNDYWESGVVRPDVILHDLIAIFHPEVLAANDRELYYYRRLE